MEITTAEGYILTKLFEAEARVEELEKALGAAKQVAQDSHRSVQHLVAAIQKHKADIDLHKAGPEDYELWNSLEATEAGEPLVPGHTEDPTLEMKP